MFRIFEMLKTFPPKFSADKFSAAPTARLAGEKRGVLFAAPRAAGGVDTSQGESRGWGGENTHVRLSLCLRGSTQNVAYTLRS